MSTRRTKPREPRKTRRIKRAPKAKATKKARHSKARVFTRGAERPTSIVPELMGVLDQLLSLMRKTKDPQQLEQLGYEHSALSEQVERLIDRQIMETTAQYHAAIEGIQQASETIEKAIEGLESVNTVILKAAKAVQLAGKVAAMV